VRELKNGEVSIVARLEVANGHWRERERVPISTCVDGKILEIEIYLIVM
jgi:hypothetical protein